MVPLCASAFIVMTGNGLSVSEDLARRFIAIELDPRTEDPEARPFRGDIRTEVHIRRADCCGRPNDLAMGLAFGGYSPGRPLGSFGQWCAWVRDPLLALGCRDPAERVSEAKARDTRRQQIADLFGMWSEHHSDRPMTAKDLHDEVRRIIDPQGRGRQFVAAFLDKMGGTRLGGYVLTRQAPAGTWGAATYALLNPTGSEKHREHRGHSAQEPSDAPYAPDASGGRGMNHARARNPVPPMPPLPSENAGIPGDGGGWEGII